MEQVPNERLLDQLEWLSGRDDIEKNIRSLLSETGYEFNLERLKINYEDYQLFFSTHNVERMNFFVAVPVMDMNQLTVNAINFAVEKGYLAYCCLAVKDILMAVSENLAKSPPSERTFRTFVSWADRLDLTNIVLTRDSGNFVLKLKETVYPKTRYIPGNFSVEDLTALLLSTGDFPKTKSFA